MSAKLLWLMLVCMAVGFFRSSLVWRGRDGHLLPQLPYVLPAVVVCGLMTMLLGKTAIGRQASSAPELSLSRTTALSSGSQTRVNFEIETWQSPFLSDVTMHTRLCGRSHCQGARGLRSTYGRLQVAHISLTSGGEERAG